jgi:SWI/SNF-related matrix-associated actin-dependent regulator of chromatin subfamily A3
MTRLQSKVSITFDEAENGDEVFQLPKLVLNEDRYNIVSREGISVATMNKKAHLALRSLFLEYGIQYQGLIPKVKFKEKLDTAAQPVGLDSSYFTISMSVLVFGLRSSANLLAKALSRYRLFLQHPSIVLTDSLYENPQYPRMITSSFPNGTIIPPISVIAIQEDTEVDSLTAMVDEDPEDLITVINNLPRHDYLNEEAHIDNRVTATLLP